MSASAWEVAPWALPDAIRKTALNIRMLCTLYIINGFPLSATVPENVLGVSEEREAFIDIINM